MCEIYIETTSDINYNFEINNNKLFTSTSDVASHIWTPMSTIFN